MIKKLRPLVEAGFAIVLLKPRSKAPVDDGWTTAKVPTFEQLQRWYRPGQNVGVRLGKWSEVEDYFLHVIDVDIKDSRFKNNALDALDELLPGIDWESLPRVKSGSGGPSFHIYFLTDRPFPSKKLRKNKDEKWEIELFGTGKQVAIPPSIHPDTGNSYKWVNEPVFHAKNTKISSDLIDELVYGDEGDDYSTTTNKLTDITFDEVGDYLDWLPFDYWCDDREGWIKVGMALHHQFDGSPEAFKLWCDFSRQSDKFELRVAKQQWRSFQHKTNRPVRLATIIEAARLAATQAEFDELDDEPEKPQREPKKREEERDDGFPKHLLTVPGALQDVVEFYNKNALVNQPEFAVMAALAFGSVVLGRNTVTEFDNYSSLYFVGVGESGSGKEFVRTTVSHLLREVGLKDLLGPENMTSEGALLSYMMVRPKMVLLTDEFGKRLIDDRGGQNHMKEGVYTAYLSLFSQLGGLWQPTGYSTMSKTKEETAAIMQRLVERPALTVVGTTTPSTFFKAIGGGDVSSGFMSRFIIVQSKGPIQKQRIRTSKKKAVSERLRKWAKLMSSRAADPEEEMLLMVDQAAIVDPFVVEFSDKAHDLLEEIEEERVERMNELTGFGLNELFNRTRELAMRLAMIVAASDDYDRVQVRHLQWAWDYVRFYAEQTVESFKQNLGVSEIHKTANQIAAMIIDSGDRGLTRREISKASRVYRSLSVRDSTEVENLMRRDYGISEVTIKNDRGPGRLAFVSPKHRKPRK